MSNVISFVKRHPIGSAVPLLLVAGALYLTRDVVKVALTADTPVGDAVPQAKPLGQLGSDELLFRIDPNQSSATVVVEEELVGSSVDKATLVTQAMSGEIALNTERAADSRVGEILVDVEQLTSDNRLRDRQIRANYLESTKYPIARLSDVKLSGAPKRFEQGTKTQFTLVGDLKVHDVTNPVTFDVNGEWEGDQLRLTASTTLTLSEFKIGPVALAGLVTAKDTATLELKILARSGDSFEAPKALSEDPGSKQVTAQLAGVPSYSRDIKPILESNCVSCHGSGEMGSHLWVLNEAHDAAAVADGLATVTTAKFMPPWPAAQTNVPLQHTRGLSDAQIEAFVNWAKAGAPLDVDGSQPLKAAEDPSMVTIDDDLTITFDEPYAGSTDVKDDYRCLIMDPKLTTTQYMTGYYFTPDAKAVVHHVLTYKMDAATRAAADAKDGADGKPGWSCSAGGFGGGGNAGGQASAAGPSGATGPSGLAGQENPVGQGQAVPRGPLVAGWVPGQRPLRFAPDTGFKLNPGDYFISQMHYHYETAAPKDSSQMTLSLEDERPGIQELRTRELVGPVELPCPAGSTEALCDRDAAMVETSERLGDASMLANGLHRVCGTDPASLAAQSDGITATTTCTFNMRQPASIVDVLGHMHVIGKSFTMKLNPGTPEEKVLLDIPRWSFNWQLNYQPVEPVSVKPGDKLQISCTWDRNLQPGRPLRYIFFAEGTLDEMCFATITTLPPKPADPATP